MMKKLIGFAATVICLGILCGIGSAQAPSGGYSSPSTGSGVASLNALVGAVTLTSTGGSITITPSGSTINLETAGACATCVVATAPGVGIAHFAGGTQTVTSSAVNLASADVTGQLPIGNVGSSGLSGSGCISIAATGAISSTCLTSITFPQTVAGTVNSGGIPYFDSTTDMSSSATLTANCLIRGGGAGVAPSCSASSDNGTTFVTTSSISGATTGTIAFTSRSKIASSADGNLNGQSNAGGAMTRFGIGPDTSGNPALCPNGTGLKLGQGGATCTTLTNLQLGSLSATALLLSNTAPTIAAAGCGGSAASISANNGTAAFDINVGTGPASTGCTVTMPSATTGWNCFVNDRTTISTAVSMQKQTGAISATSVILQNYSDITVATAPSANDIYHVACTAY
jgi:hypothetical protein